MSIFPKNYFIKAQIEVAKKMQFFVKYAKRLAELKENK